MAIASVSAAHAFGFLYILNPLGDLAALPGNKDVISFDRAEFE